MTAMMRDSRTEKRATFAPEQRIVLLEQDADQFEAAGARISRQLNKLIWIGMGGLISFSTAAVLLAIDLVSRSGG